MEAVETILLFDYYGRMLTDKQKEYLDLRYNQDLSLGEIGEALGVSRQAVCDNLARTEEILRRMEENIGCVSRNQKSRKALQAIAAAAAALENYTDEQVRALANRISAAVKELEE